MFKVRKLSKRKVNVTRIVDLVPVTVEEENDNGSVVSRVVLQQKDYSIVENLNLPTADEYTLENLMAAGVGLDSISVSGLLNKTDKADLDILREYSAANDLELVDEIDRQHKYMKARKEYEESIRANEKED